MANRFSPLKMGGRQLLCSLFITTIVSSAGANPAYAGAIELFNQGVSLMTQEKHREALSCFEAATKANPQFEEAWVNKGCCLSQLKYYEKAIECYTQAIKIQPKLSVAYDNRGTSKLALKRYAEALEDFNKSISLPRISPLGSITVYADRARAYAGLGRWKECFRDFDYVLKYPSKDPRMESIRRITGLHYRVAQIMLTEDINKLANEGATYLKDGKYKKAIEFIDKSLALKPSQPDLIAMKAEAFIGSKQPDEALKMLNKAVEMNPRMALLRMSRAELNISRKHYTEAIDDLSKALDLGYRTSPAYRYRSVAQFLSGKTEPAIKDINDAIMKDGKDADNYFLRAVEATADSDNAKAAEEAMRYLEVTEWNGPCAREALSIAFLAKANADGEESALKLFEQRPKDGEVDKVCSAAGMIQVLKKEKTEADEVSHCANSNERDGVELVGAWLKLKTGSKQEGLAKLKAYVDKGNPLDTPYWMTVAILRQAEPKALDTVTGAPLNDAEETQQAKAEGASKNAGH